MKILISLMIISNHINCNKNENLVKDGFKENQSIQVPKLALKLLVDSSVDPCPICAEKLKKQAFSILTNEFQINRKFVGNGTNKFVRTDECGLNEFVLTSYKKREIYKPENAESEMLFPLLVFKFYTDDINLIGIHRKNYTQKKFSMLMNEASKGTNFHGEIEIIEYKYGDGPTYNYFKKKNQVQVHCRILKLENYLRKNTLTKKRLLLP